MDAPRQGRAWRVHRVRHAPLYVVRCATEQLVAEYPDEQQAGSWAKGHVRTTGHIVDMDMIRPVSYEPELVP